MLCQGERTAEGKFLASTEIKFWRKTKRAARMGTAAISGLAENLCMKKLSWAFKSHLSKAEYHSAQITGLGLTNLAIKLINTGGSRN